MNVQQQIDYLKKFITEKRYEKFKIILSNRTRYITVVIEDIFQGHNASAVLRTCDCFGIQDVHCIENRNIFQPNEEVSMGAAQWLSIHRYNEKEVNNTEICFKRLREKGYRIIGTSPHIRAKKIQELDINNPVALVFGSEKLGLSEHALQHADEWVYVPMCGFTESLNISVCVAICLFELTNKLYNSHIPYHMSEEEKQEILLQWIKNTLKDAEKILERYNKF